MINLITSTFDNTFSEKQTGHAIDEMIKFIIDNIDGDFWFVPDTRGIPPFVYMKIVDDVMILSRYD